MHAAYLNGVSRQSSSFNNKLEILEAGRDVWYAAQYSDVKYTPFSSIKQQIVTSINAITGEKTDICNYDWHHVVETQHIAQFLFTGSLEDQKWSLVPTILIHKPEHRFFSQNFNNNEFRELSGTEKSNQNSFSLHAASTKTERDNLRVKINSIQYMYDLMYLNYPTLKTIAKNIFDYHLNLL
jgi:hypothetical protein